MSEDRVEIIDLINTARESGARQSQACEIIGMIAKTSKLLTDHKKILVVYKTYFMKLLRKILDF